MQPTQCARVFRVLPALLSLVAMLSCLQPAYAAAPAGEPIDVYAILSTSGNSAFFGQAEARALKVLEPYVNAQGGIRGRPVRFVVLDDTTNTQVTVQLVNQLAAKKIPIFLGPTNPGGCSAAGPIVEKSGPVSICLNPSGHPPAGGYLFTPYADSYEVAAASLRYFRERGITRIALLNAIDSSGRDADLAFEAAFRLPENRLMQKVAQEHYAPGDATATAQLSRIKATDPQAIVSFNSGLPFGTVLRGMHDIGLSVPVSTTGGNMTFGQMQQYKSFLPPDVLFGGTIAWAPGDIGPGPIHDAQMTYVRELQKSSLRPEAGAVTIWDAALIAVEVLRRVGPDADSESARAALAAIRGWVGTAGVYDFRSYPQHGVGANSVLIMRWNPATEAFEPASRRGGAIRR